MIWLIQKRQEIVLRINVLYSLNGCSKGEFKYPYEAKSLTLNKNITFNSVEDVYLELERCYDEAVSEGYPIGAALYHQHFFFANSQDILDSYSQRIIKEYAYCKETNTPPFQSIQQTPANYIDNFMIIKEEINEFNKQQKERKK